MIAPAGASNTVLVRRGGVESFQSENVCGSGLSAIVAVIAMMAGASWIVAAASEWDAPSPVQPTLRPLPSASHSEPAPLAWPSLSGVVTVVTRDQPARMSGASAPQVNRVDCCSVKAKVSIDAAHGKT